MTHRDLDRLEDQMKPLVSVLGASPSARDEAARYNAEARDVRDALLDPARDLLAKGSLSDELGECLERTVAQLSFWRRVLVGTYPGSLRTVDAPAELRSAPPALARKDFLVDYVLS